VVKRGIDVVVALAVLLLLLPILAVLAVAIKLESAGPVFYSQTRVGRGGRLFRLHKFRSMRSNAEASGPPMTGRSDPRVTRVGRILRLSRLDELPQLWNVLTGDMSLVGPRPEVPAAVERYSAAQRKVLQVRPGITGPTQLGWLDESDRYPVGVDVFEYYVSTLMPQKLETDLAYLRSRTVATDLGYLVKTPYVLGRAVLTRFLASPLAAKGGRLSVDCLAVAGANGLALAIWLQSPGHASSMIGSRAVQGLALACTVYTLSFVLFQCYRSIWRYASDIDFWQMLAALLWGAALHVAVVRLVAWPYPRSVLLLTPLIAALLIGGVRLVARRRAAIGLGVVEITWLLKAVPITAVAMGALVVVFGSNQGSRLILLIALAALAAVLFACRAVGRAWLVARRRRDNGQRQRALLIGVGDPPPRLAHTLNDHTMLEFEPVGYLDDNPSRRGATIAGLQVLGSVAELPVIARRESIDIVVVFFSHVTAPALRFVIDHCRGFGVEYRLIPTIQALHKDAVRIPGLEEADPADGNGTAGDQHDSPANGNGTSTGGHPALRRVPTRAGASTILVTGGAGYIGSHVVRKLLLRGHRVRVVDSLLYGTHGIRAIARHPRLELIEGDVRHLRTMHVAVKGVDAVIALAALVGDAACELDPDETLSTNLDATQLLAEVGQRAGLQRLVFASSCSVYGANGALTLNEGSWLNPVSIYARTRLQSEKLLLQQANGPSVTILRLATVFGVSSRMRLDLLVNTFTAHGFFTDRMRVFGGTQQRPNLHVQDAAEAFILAAQGPAEKVSGEIFNVGDDTQNYTVLDVAELVKAELPTAEIELVDGSPDARDYRVGFEKIRQVLGFRCRFTVQDGIREMVAAFRHGLVRDPNAERYHNFRYLKAHGFGRVPQASRAAGA
jgi:lipopolysaccharide/colanic/teichoic acid biosynthesis glycosyltransferase/nucleoside-diphosphate-sugar epimerase